MKRVFTKVFSLVLLTIVGWVLGLTAQAQTFTQAVATNGTNARVTALTTDKFGNVWAIVDPSNASTSLLVEYVGATGSPVQKDSGIPISDSFDGATIASLASDSHGNIYLSTNNPGTAAIIYKYDASSSYARSTLVTGSDNIGYFEAINVGPDDNLYVVQYNANGNTAGAGLGDFEVARYPTTTTTVNTATVGGTPLYTDLDHGFFAGGASHNYSHIVGLQVDASLNIYVADGFDENVVPNSTNGSNIYKLLKPGSGNNYTLGGSVAANLHATALAMNTTRTNLYASVSLTFNATYSVVEFIGGTGSPTTLYTGLTTGGVNYPFGLAYVSDSELFVGDGLVNSSNVNNLDIIYGIPAQASGVNFTGTTEKTTTINWTNGGGSSRAVFAALSTAGSISLTNGTAYTASTTFGSGTAAGTGWNCVYNGTGNSVGISGLTASTGYKVMVVEYNGSAGAQNYATGTGTNNPNTFTALANPSLTASGGNTNYNVGGSAVAVDAGITATAGQTNLSTATVQITTNFSSGDVLNFTNQNGITGSFSGSTLTLSGSATVANYQTALQSITFSSSSVSAATRTVSFLVGDGTANSSTVTKNITVTAGTTITSIAAASSITNASTTTFNVVLAGSVTGLSTSNFGVATTGTVGGASVASVSGSGTTYTVTVNTGTGDGTIGLNLNNSTGLTPSVTNAPFTGGTIVIDKTAPTVIISSPSVASIADGAGSVTYTVTYADANFASSTLTTGDISLNTTGTATGTIGLTGSGTLYTVTISGINGSGKIGISLAAGTASDAAGNLAPAAGPSVTFNALSTNAVLTKLVTNPSIPLSTVTGTDYKDFRSIVGNSVSSVTISPFSRNNNCTTTINGIPVALGAPSDPIALIVGDNTVTIVSTAEDGVTTKTYGITITRQVPNVLASLTVSPSIPLSPVSGADYKDYRSVVVNSISSVTITPTSLDPTNTIKVNALTVASGTASGAITLNVGDNIINTVVSDGITTKTYSITVTRLAPAILTALKVSPTISLSPSAGPDYKDYKSIVANSISAVSITPTAGDPSNTITVNTVPIASGATSAAIPLSVGDNTINTTVSDGITSNTYSIKITRLAPPGGASLYDEKLVAVAPVRNTDIVVHQNISPNGDGNSDVLLIDGITTYPDNTLQIMSRNGVLVYEAKGYDNATKVFDGHSSTNGKLQQAGTYFYSLEYKAGTEIKRKTGYLVLKY